MQSEAQETRDRAWLYLRGASTVRDPGVGAAESCPGPCGAGCLAPSLGVPLLGTASAGRSGLGQVQPFLLAASGLSPLLRL